MDEGRGEEEGEASTRIVVGTYPYGSAMTRSLRFKMDANLQF
jgi:hypothetical protein